MSDFFKKFGGVSEQEAQTQGGDFFAQFGGSRDAVSQPQESDPEMRQLAINLAKHIFGGGGILSAAKAMAGPMASEAYDMTAKPAVDFAAGFGKGVTRHPVAPDATGNERLGSGVGRAALPAAGAVAGAMAAPVIAPAAVVAAPLLATAAGAGLGAAAGNTASQVAAKATGGEAPATLGDAASESAKVGLEAAAADLGVGVAMKGVAMASPRVVSMFKSFPKEELKRILSRPNETLSVFDSVGGAGSAAQSAAEKKAIGALRTIQTRLVNARRVAGQEVDAALDGFQAATNGAKVIDASEAATVGAEAMASRSTSEGVSAMTEAEVKKIQDLITKMESTGPMSARDTVVWRQKLDNLINYKRGAVPEITSGEGQNIISAMARRLREQITEAAQAAKYTKLEQANARFHEIATTYDAYRPAFTTKTASAKEAIKKIEGVASHYNMGGEAQAELTAIGQKIPDLGKPIDKLLDAIAARRLTLESKGSPSGTMMTAIRFIAGPDGLATAANVGRRGAGGLRRGAAASAAAIGAQK